MPSPNKGEKQDEFISRCMGDEEANKTFEDPAQRAAFCHSQWDNKDKAKDAKILPIRMIGEDMAELLLYDMIGADPFFGLGIGSKGFRDQVKSIKAKTLNLRVNSPGGDVFEAAAMMAALDEFRGKVVVDVDGLAASAASFLIMGADEIRLGSNSLMMIHDPYGGVVGNADDMRARAALLDKVKGQILDSYQRKSKQPREQLAAWMQAETWFTGQEAVDAGLADRVTEPVRVAALAQHSAVLARMPYRHIPEIPQDTAAWQATRARQVKLAALLHD